VEEGRLSRPSVAFEHEDTSIATDECLDVFQRHSLVAGELQVLEVVEDAHVEMGYWFDGAKVWGCGVVEVHWLFFE
jgi:hypothetical protein